MSNFDLQELTGIGNGVYILVLAALVVVLLIVVIVQSAKTSKLKKRYEAFMTGKDMISLEDALRDQVETTDELKKNVENNTRDIMTIAGKMKHSFQKVGVVKYDAFNEMGGKLSFSLALLDERDDGIILNAMHSREGCYTYIKEIVKGNAYIVLAEEEARALAIAKGEIVENDDSDI